MKHLLFFSLFFIPFLVFSQSTISWRNVDAEFGPLPPSVHIYFSDQKMDTAPFKAYYLIADLKDKRLNFTTDTTKNRRLTPSGFYEKNNRPVVVVNATFFSFETNRNLNLVIKDKKLVSYNVHAIAGRGKDTLTYRHPLVGALGIRKNRTADVAWTYTDSADKHAFAVQYPISFIKDSSLNVSAEEFLNENKRQPEKELPGKRFKKWKMKTAVGGGPVLLQNGQIRITNNEERKFAGKAINDKHPRTAIGYTADNKLIILVVEGRSESAGGVTLPQEAKILQELGCVEALNLDGGGSSCMLVNGKLTIKPSDKGNQRPVPGVFIIDSKN
jgi:exopolysaccharide biosynthesis protein